MKAVKYLLSIWVGVLIYTAFSFIYGSMGLSAYRQLDDERKKQESNLENLRNINMELEDTVSSLLYDEDTIAVYAREQGYASGVERFIRVVGMTGHQKTRTSAGEIIAFSEPDYIPNRTLGIIAFCFAASFFFCFALFDFMRFLRER